jgi:DNA repair exonuclease SbcCD nuclease subunit
MRLLLFADLHLDAPFAWAPPAVSAARRHARKATLTRICELAVELGVDALCSAGDLYEHDRLTPDTREFVRSQFARLAPMPVFLAPGNHDWLAPTSLYRQAVWSPNVHVFDAPRLAPVRIGDGVTLWGAGHDVPAATRGFLDGFRVEGSGVHLALFHGSEQGELRFESSEKVPHAPFSAGQIRAAGLHHALVGHFHTPRLAEDHTYPGNPEPLAFGEKGERGAVLITIDDTGVVGREVQRVAASRVHDVRVDLDGVEHSGDVRARVAAALSGLDGTARVTLAGEVGPAVEVGLDVVAACAPPGLFTVPRLGALTVRYDEAALALEPTVRGEFVRAVRAADLPEAKRNTIMITGLRALDGRHDLEVR